ncbi:MAG: acyltransferase family protein [Sulfurovaceae bacterium]
MQKMNYTQSISLDLLRIFAVQLVVVGHALSYFNIGRINYIQNSAVVLFFILSGIVITYSLLYKLNDNPSYKFRDFFIDRFSRIYTGLVPSLIFIFLFDSIQVYILENKDYHFFNAFDIKTFIGNLLMLQDFPKLNLGITSFASGRPLWTLAIEWWLYMSFGLIVIHYTKRFNIKYFIFLIFFMIVPLYNAYGGRGESLTLFWLGGALLSILSFKHKIQIVKSLSIFFSLILIILIYKRLSLTKEAYDMVYVILITLFIFFYLQVVSNIKFSSDKIKKVIHFIAGYSFTLYLIHYTIFDLIAYFNQKNFTLWVFFFAIIISNVLALILAYYTEMRYKQFRNLLSNFFIKKEEAKC